MGPFLVEPLLEELATVAESPAPLHDARRLLEVHMYTVFLNGPLVVPRATALDLHNSCTTWCLRMR